MSSTPRVAGSYVVLLVVANCLIVSSGCRQGNPMQHTVSAWVDAWNRRDLNAMESLFAPGAQFVDLGGRTGPPTTQRAAFQPMWNLVPDIRMRVVRWIPTESGIAYAWAAEGRAQRGPVVLRGITVVEGTQGHFRVMRMYGDVRPLLSLMPQRKRK